MINTSPTLTPRLYTISKQIDKCKCFADIGTDHAYLPVFMCMTGKCERAIASDINEGPLKRAQNTVRQFGQEEKIQLRLGSGLDTLEENEADVIVIAGMGGIEISNILKIGKSKISPSATVIIQPMTSVPELREFLFENGWSVTKEILAKEDEKIYNIISVKFEGAPPQKQSEVDLYLGKYLIDNKPEYFEEYLLLNIKKVKSALSGLEFAKSDEAKERKRYFSELLVALEKI